jgi:hypothetical protein
MDGFRMPYPAMQVGTRWNCAKRECRYVDHLIDALVKLMATPDRVTGPINIGNQSECSMLELAGMIVELTGSPSRTVYRPLPENDPRQRRPDVSRAQELLSWAPRTRLKEGLIRTICYFEELVSEDRVRRAFALERGRLIPRAARFCSENGLLPAPRNLLAK